VEEMEDRIKRLQEWIRPEVRGLQPYVPEPSGPSIRLDANESPFDMPAELKKTIWDAFSAQTWNRYPDPECRELRQAMAQAEQVDPNQIVFGNGSDEIIRDLLVCYGGPGTRTVFPTPTFSMYRLLTIALGGTPVGIRLQEDWSLDLPSMQQEINAENTRMVFISRPNNPTGNAFPVEQILELVKGTDRLVVVDEAYRLFATQSLVPYLKEYPNMVVLCTYSKAMSAAGVRIGYLLGHPNVVETINRVRLPYNMDIFAQQVAMTAIQNKEVWQENAQKIIQERERFSAALSQIEGVLVYPSQSNFLLIQVADAEKVKAVLAENNIAVRGFPKTEGLGECLRITIGLPEENDACIKYLTTAVTTQKG
jgi:histidinol-phosphate aminotransferase